MVTCGDQTFFSALYSPAEKISILSAGETRAKIGCSAGLLWAGESLFMFVLLEPSSLLLPAGYWNGEYRKRFAATGLMLSKRVFNKKLTLN